MTDDTQRPAEPDTAHELPADPEGYAIEYAGANASKFKVTRLMDGKVLGTYATREAAVAAAEADPKFP